MPSTHQQLLYHVVFSTRNRKPYLANENHRDKVFAYMAGIAKNLEGFALEIGGWIDHAHLLVRIPAKTAVSSFVGGIKANTSKHINETSGLIKKFGWQEGFGAFSVSVSQKDKVARYIQNQTEHHARESFQDEYIGLLEKHDLPISPSGLSRREKRLVSYTAGKNAFVGHPRVYHGGAMTEPDGNPSAAARFLAAVVAPPG